MKYTEIKIFLSLAVLALLVVNCNNNSTQTPQPSSSTPTTYMRVTIDGQPWEAVDLSTNTVITDGVNKRMDLRGIDASGNQIILTMNQAEDGLNCFPTQTYPHAFGGGTEGISIFTYVDISGTNLGGFVTSGNATVTSCDESNKRISGTFDYYIFRTSIGDTIHYSNGKFSNLTWQ